MVAGGGTSSERVVFDDRKYDRGAIWMILQERLPRLE
jgi:hypothetical protein